MQCGICIHYAPNQPTEVAREERCRSESDNYRRTSKTHCCSNLEGDFKITFLIYIFTICLNLCLIFLIDAINIENRRKRRAGILSQVIVANNFEESKPETFLNGAMRLLRLSQNDTSSKTPIVLIQLKELLRIYSLYITPSFLILFVTRLQAL